MVTEGIIFKPFFDQENVAQLKNEGDQKYKRYRCQR